MVYRFADCIIDIEKREVRTKSGALIELTGLEFRLLCLFAENATRTLSRDDISRAINGHEWSPLDRTIDGHVGRLRRKLDSLIGQSDVIKTVRGAGYVLASSVDRLASFPFEQDDREAYEVRTGRRPPHYVAFANVDHCLGLLNGQEDVLSANQRANVTRILIEQEDTFARNLEALEFAESRAAACRDRADRQRRLLESLDHGSAEWVQAERLLVNFESLAQLVEDFNRQMRKKVNETRI